MSVDVDAERQLERAMALKQSRLTKETSKANGGPIRLLGTSSFVVGVKSFAPACVLLIRPDVPSCPLAHTTKVCGGGTPVRAEAAEKNVRGRRHFTARSPFKHP